MDVCAYVCGYLQRLEEEVRSPGTAVTGSYKQKCFLKTNIMVG